MRKEPHLLDDVADPAAQLHRVDLRDVLAVDQDPARGRFDQPVHHHHRGGLAAARGADQGDQLPLGDLEGQVVDRGRPVRVDLADLLEPDHECTVGAGRGRRKRAGTVRGTAMC